MPRLGSQTWGGTAQMPALKWSGAELCHLSRFIPLPEMLSPQNISPRVPLALLQRCSHGAGPPSFPARALGQ